MDEQAPSHLYQNVNQPELGTLDLSARARAGVDRNPGEAWMRPSIGGRMIPTGVAEDIATPLRRGCRTETKDKSK